MKSVGMLLVIAGCITVVVGLVLLLVPRMPWLGHLPGDIHYQSKNTSFHFPVLTCIVVSIVLTVVINLVLRLRHPDLEPLSAER
jgi:hypothetical protein